MRTLIATMAVTGGVAVAGMAFLFVYVILALRAHQGDPRYR